ncbi:MAG: protein tyrosine phosphatase family protein [Alphaproteobacteria bacterium]|nr:protein tyrosine phosphatase family protein [Alphaproteobacteria bacterium]
MRFALLASAFLFAAPAFSPTFAEEPLHFPKKLDRTDFQQIISDVGPIYIAGQPTADAMRSMAAEGVTTVINLRTQQEMDNRKQVPYDEAALVKELGMTYIHIPLGGPDTPYSPAAVEQVAAAIKAAGDKPILLHCTVAWRASHMWAAYLMKHRGVSRDEAIAQAKAINLGGAYGGVFPLDQFLGEASGAAPASMTPRPVAN